jgi:hypothetical protein
MGKYKWGFENWLPVLIGIFFWWYFYSVSPPFLTTLGQSTQILRLGLTGGNMDLPMFGGLLRLIHSLTFMPLAGYQLGYLLASGLAGAGLGLFYRLLTVMETDTVYRGTKMAYLIKILAVIGLSQTLAYKIQAIWLERYILPLILMLAVILLGHRLYHHRSDKNGLIGISLLMAVGLTSHWAFVGLALLVVAAWYLGPKRLTGRQNWYPLGWLMAVTVSAVSLAYLLGFRPAVVNSYLASPTVGSLLLTYYRSYLADGWQLNSLIEPAKIMMTARWLVSDFIKMIGMGGFLFGLAGLILVYQSPNRVWRYYLLLFGWLAIAPLIGFSGMTGQTLISQWFLVWWLVIWASGWWQVAILVTDRLYRALCLLHRQKPVLLIMSLGWGAVAGAWLFTGRNLPAFVTDETKVMSEVLAQVPQGSVLFCFDPAMCAAVLYTQTEQALGPEVTVVPFDYQPNFYHLPIDNLRPFGYRTYPYMIHEIMATALAAGRPVVSLAPSAQYWQWLGFELGVVHFIPQGNFGQLALATPQDWPAIEPLTLKLMGPSAKAGPVSPIITKLIDNRLVSARVNFLSHRYSQGYEEMNTTAAQVWQLPKAVFENFQVARNEMENLSTNSLFAQAGEIESASLLLTQVPDLITAERYNRAAEFCRGALMLEPFDRTVRQRVAEYYGQMGLTDLMEQEKLNAASIVQ